MNLYEVLNTRIPIENWNQEDNRLIGQLVIDNFTYHIFLEPRTYPFNNKIYNFINVGFAKMVNNKPEYGITFDKASSTKRLDAAKTSKIVGAISNGLIDKLKDYHYDAVVLIAQDDVEQRMRIYNMIARWEINHLGGKILNNIVLPKEARATIIFSKEFDDTTIKNFIAYVKTLVK